MFLLDRIFHRHPSPPPGSGDLIHWDESLSVGHELIDAEHREIIALLNALYSDWREGAHHLNLRKTLARLHGVVETHFSNEETVLARHLCPTLAEHRAEHARLLGELAGIAAAPRLEEAAMLIFARELVMNHVLDWDLAAKDYLRE